jgi:hypothetical protein
LSEFPRNAAGSTLYVDGYGLGVVFWILATCFLVIATRQSYREKRRLDNSQESGEELISRVGSFVALGFAVFVCFQAYSDRKLANKEERAQLQTIVFKRGEICSMEQPTILKSVSTNGQIIELVVDSEYSSLGAIGNLRTLLDLGAGTVRFRERDFSYQISGVEKLLTSVPSRGERPVATLRVSSTSEGSKTEVRLQVMNSEKHTLVDHTWRLDSRGVACPDFSVHAEKDKQPTKTLMSTLRLETKLILESKDTKSKLIPYNNRVIGSIESIDDTNLIGKNALTSDSTQFIPDWKGNVTCPMGVGWNPKGPKERSYSGWPFMQGDRAWHFSFGEQSGVLCNEDSYFLYSGVERDGKYYMQIQQRTSVGFTPIWAAVSEISGDGAPKRSGSLWLRHVELNGNDLLFTGYDEDFKRMIRFRVTKQ